MHSANDASENTSNTPAAAADELIARALPVVDAHTACALAARQQRLLSSHLGHSLLLCHLQDSLPLCIGDLADGAPMAGQWQSNGRQTPARAIYIDPGRVRARARAVGARAQSAKDRGAR